MKKRKILWALLAVLICVFIAACKKNVGTPEDNAVTEESGEEVTEEEDTYVLGFTGIELYNPYFITL